MSIAISDAHRDLADVVRSFAESQGLRRLSRSLLDAPEESLPPFWSELVALGWTGIHLPEAFGGSGYSLPELVIVLEELGAAVAPGPFLPTVIASATILAAATPEQHRLLLPPLSDGSSTAAIGLGGSLRGGAGSVEGSAAVVLGAATATVLVLVAGDDVLVVSREAPGLHVEVAGNTDPTRRCGLVRLDDVDLSDVEVIRGARGRLQATAWALAAAEAAGGARACVEMASEYAKTREQFGRVIGTFGPVKHHCANMLVGTELATAASWDAARSTAGDADQFSLAAAASSAVALPAFLRAAQLNVQVHGGIGFTWEHDCHVLLRRAIALSALFDPGAAADEVARLARRGVRRVHGLELPPEAEVVRPGIRRLVEEIAALPVDRRRARLIESGLVMPHWPRPWGRASSAVEQLVIDEEMERLDVQRPGYGITGWITLTLIQHASPAQIERWVRPTLEGRLVWCQLFSEPNAGSDAAGIRTRGVRVDGGWLVTGQKVWTSGAQFCDRGLATIRTDPNAPKHAGITTMVFDMRADGVEVRPLREATGGAMFNEVFLDEVFVGDDDVVGPVNGGWTVARATLGNERVSIGGGGPGVGFDLLAISRDVAEPPGAGRLVGELLAEAQAMSDLNLRRAERAVAGAEPGPEGNVTKLLSAEHAQRVADAALTVLGPAVAITEGDGGKVSTALLFTRALSIAGGTSEITRNQIAERILGLPRDPLTN